MTKTKTKAKTKTKTKTKAIGNKIIVMSRKMNLIYKNVVFFVTSLAFVTNLPYFCDKNSLYG